MVKIRRKQGASRVAAWSNKSSEAWRSHRASLEPVGNFPPKQVVVEKGNPKDEEPISMIETRHHINAVMESTMAAGIILNRFER